MCSSISSCVVKFLAQTWHMMWFCLCISSSVSLPGTSADAPTVSNISPIVRFYFLHFHFYHFLVLENLLSSRNKRHSHLYGIVFHFVAFFVIVHMDEFILYSGTLYYFFFYSARPALLVQLKLLWVAAAWINPSPWSIFYCFHMAKFNGKSTELFMFSSFMCFQIVYSLNSFYKYSKRKRKSIKNGNGNILHYYKNKNLNVNRIGKANRNAKLVLTIWRMKESMSMRSLIKFLSGGGQRKDGWEGLYESSFPATDFYSRDFTDMII